MTDERRDEPLDAWARSLREPVDAARAEALWTRIDAALDEVEDAERGARPVSGPTPRSTPLPWTALITAAASLLAVALLLAGRAELEPSALLAASESRRLDAELGKLERRLAHLQPRFAGDAVDATPIVVVARLETLRANVERCREAALINRNNRDVRRSLVATTRRMVETLELALDASPAAPFETSRSPGS